MYSDEDLDSAVKKGIFTKAAVLEFRTQFSNTPGSTAVDEENFRLVTGFNDIFVVIACGLLLYSSYSVLGAINTVVSLLSLPLLAWGLAEFFVRKRKMALPAMVLMLVFVGGVFALSRYLFSSASGITYVAATGLSAIAAFVHYQRFQVPITVAAGAATALGFIAATVLYYLPGAINSILMIVLISGIFIFLLAMYWDASDLKRTTRRTDVAFWLHLLSAPMIVHPIFAYLGILEGKESTVSIAIVIVLYLLMTLVSIIIDRRAFMVSSLLYVMYALSNLFTIYGIVGYNLAATGVCIGGGLLLLSAFWRPVRSSIVKAIPVALQQFVPKT